MKELCKTLLIMIKNRVNYDRLTGGDGRTYSEYIVKTQAKEVLQAAEEQTAEEQETLEETEEE